MKKALLTTAIVSTISGGAIAADTFTIAKPTLYGKFNVSLNVVDDGTNTSGQLSSNASRIGIKGSQEVAHGLKAIYKFELEHFTDDGEKSSGNTFSQRNTYVGLKGSFGQVIAGKFDTPLKAAQKKVDLFGDLVGDIKQIVTNSDNRNSNSVQYTTPSLGGVVANIDYITPENTAGVDGYSSSISYTLKNSGLYMALAYDKDVEDSGYEVLRAVGQLNIESIQLGALIEQQKIDGGETTEGYLVSAAYKLGKSKLKAQYGTSDIKSTGGSTLSLGVDYKLAKNVKTFGFATIEGSDGSEDKKIIGAGMELKF
jgi:predicted porin